MNQIDKIKADIERLKKNLPWGGSAGQLAMECNCKNEAYNEVLSFIESLEEEPKPNICPRCAYYQYDSCNYPGGGRNALYNENGICECNMFESLEKEQEGLLFTPLGRLIQKLPWNDSTNSYAKKLVDCLVREGYIKDAQIVQGIVSYKNGNNVPMATMDEVHIQFNDEQTFKREQSQGLDEAAIKYLRQYDKDNDGEEPCATEVFKAGVKFQAEQGYSREVEVKEDAGGYPYINEIELYDYDNDKPLAKKGDKVRIQITKL